MTSTRSDVINIDKVVTMLCIGGYFPSIQDPHRIDLSSLFKSTLWSDLSKQRKVYVAQESGPRPTLCYDNIWLSVMKTYQQGQVWIYILCLFFYTQFDITLSLVDLLKDLITSFFHDNL